MLKTRSSKCGLLKMASIRCHTNPQYRKNTEISPNNRIHSFESAVRRRTVMVAMVTLFTIIPLLPNSAAADTSSTENTGRRFHKLIDDLPDASGKHRLDIMMAMGKVLEFTPGLKAFIDVNMLNHLVDLTRLAGELPLEDELTKDVVAEDDPRMITLLTRMTALALLQLAAPERARDAANEMLTSPHLHLRNYAGDVTEALNPPRSVTLSNLTAEEFAEVVLLLLKSKDVSLRLRITNAVSDNRSSLIGNEADQMLHILKQAYADEQAHVVQLSTIRAIIDLPLTVPGRTEFLQEIVSNPDTSNRIRDYAEVVLEHEKGG